MILISEVTLKKQIFYFTGTGNCLSIARKLNGILKDYSLHSIISDFKLAEEYIERQIIVVTPVYMYNLPYVVRNFLENLSGSGHCSIVFAGGGEIGKCFSESKKLFQKKSIKLNSQFNIPMPSNYTPYGGN